MRLHVNHLLIIPILFVIVLFFLLHNDNKLLLVSINEPFYNRQQRKHHLTTLFPDTRMSSQFALKISSRPTILGVTMNDAVMAWSKSNTSLCNGSFTGFAHLFAILKEILLDPSFSAGPQGGERIESVLNQPEEKEFLTLKSGYFQIRCDNNTPDMKYKFQHGDHLVKWMAALKPVSKMPAHQEVDKITIAVSRYEYANLYHTMTDWYNAFLMLLFFNVKSFTANILFVDSHPQGGLDSIWTTLFGGYVRAGQLKTPLYLKTLIWNIQGYKSPMFRHNLPSIPHIEKFRLFFLAKHNVPNTKRLNCDQLHITFLWRRDYVAHPRNPRGIISRKVKNENELEDSVHKLYPIHSIVSLRTKNMSMHDQLGAIAKTDILVGMHGAGLTLALFLPKHAGLIELYPKYWSVDNAHFNAIARWRNLHYTQWQNRDDEMEFPNYFTYIPPSVIQNLLYNIIALMCKP